MVIITLKSPGLVRCLRSAYRDAADISPGMIAPEALPVVIDHPPFKIS
jgi:hypothetical protein